MSASEFMQRRAKSLIRGSAALVVWASAVSFAAAQPKPTLEYIFDSTKDSLSKAGGIIDHSGNKYNGTEISAGTETSFVPGHTPLNPNVAQGTAVLFLGDDDPNMSMGTDPSVGTLIDTGIDTGTVGLDNQSFTVMAWVYRTAFKEDNMVFGSGAGSGSFLHLGFRRGEAYFGTWNGDSAAYVPSVGGWEWHHMAWRYDATKGTHTIYVDGKAVIDEPGAVFPGYQTNLTIGGNFGYAGGGAGCFAGAIEHPRVYGGQALRDDQVAADAQDLPIPP